MEKCEKITFMIDGKEQIFEIKDNDSKCYVQYNNIKQLIEKSNNSISICVCVLEYPDIKTNENAKLLLDGIWNYGSLFTILCKTHNVEYVEQIINDKYVGEYTYLKDLILDTFRYT